jgi:hypothetical protein
MMNSHQQPIQKESTKPAKSYSYPELTFKKSALAPGQNSIGTGDQYSIGADSQPFSSMRPAGIVTCDTARIFQVRAVYVTVKKLSRRFLQLDMLADVTGIRNCTACRPTAP